MCQYTQAGFPSSPSGGQLTESSNWFHKHFFLRCRQFKHPLLPLLRFETAKPLSLFEGDGCMLLSTESSYSAIR